MRTAGLDLKPVEFVVMAMVIMNEAICASMLFPFVGLFVAHLENPDAANDLRGDGVVLAALSRNASFSNVSALMIASHAGASVDDGRSESGYYAGLLVGLFQFAQFLAAPRWGYVGDVFGRKPVFLTGLILSTVIVICFGLSQSVWMAMLLRLAHGASNANAAVAKTYVAEVSTKETQAMGFGMLSVSWAVGAFIGPSFGGVLYDPARNHFLAWARFSRTGIFGRNPALLPCLASAAYSMMSTMLCVIFLKESNPRARDASAALQMWFRWLRRRLRIRRYLRLPTTSAPRDERNGNSDDDDEEALDRARQAAQPAPPPPFGLVDLFNHSVLRLVIPMYGVLAAFNIVFNETFPLFSVAYTIHEGLGMTSEQVGVVFMMNAVVSFFANMYFAPMTKQYPLLYLWRVSMVVQAIVMFGYGSLSVIAQHASFGVMMAVIAVLSIARTSSSTIAFSLCMMFTANAAPRDQLGTVTGLSHACGCIMRSIGPIVGAPIFAWSIAHRHMFPFNHYLIFTLCSLLAVVGYLLSLRVAEEQVTPRDINEASRPTSPRAPPGRGAAGETELSVIATDEVDDDLGNAGGDDNVVLR